LKNLTVVLKTVERCNIDCTYCYFFHSGDESYKIHPPYIKQETIEKTAHFIRKGVLDLGIKTVNIGFHGGEPMMQKPKHFDEMCETFKKNIQDVADVNFTIQTNAILVNDVWVELFHKHQVGIGVSLDGPKEYNDKYRLDKKGRGTYDKTVSGLKILSESALIREYCNVGVLCVINPNHDPKKIYRHFVDDLNIRNMDFLLPDSNYENPLPYDPALCGEYLCQLFDEWTKDNDPGIKIRFLKSTLNAFLGQSSTLYGIGSNNLSCLPLITISSNGDLSPVDELRSTDSNIMQTGYNVNRHTLKEFLVYPIFNELKSAQANLPKKCSVCIWNKVCAGGTLVSRYSESKKFDNPSYLCDGLFNYYSHVAAYMIQHDYSLENMRNVLDI